jgi:hypothetical protein
MELNKRRKGEGILKRKETRIENDEATKRMVHKNGIEE